MGKNLRNKIHILEDVTVCRQYVLYALLHRVNVKRQTVSIHIKDFYRLLGLLSADIWTLEGIYYYDRDRKYLHYDEGFCGAPETASNLCLDRLGPDLIGCIELTWGLTNNCRGWSAF